MCKKLLFVALLIACQQAFGQSYDEFWTRIMINKKIDKNWTLGGDVQYRSQENYHEQNNLRFQNPLLQSFRTTIYYRLSSKYRVDLTASPLVYFRSFDVDRIGEVSDQREIRVVFGGLQHQNIFKKVKLRNRFQSEARFLRVDRPDNFFQNRLRWQIQATMPIYQTKSKIRSINCLIFNEIFIAHQQGNAFFDQNRFYNAIQFKHKFIELNLGYQFSVQRLIDELVARNQLHLSLTFSLD